MHLTDMAVRRQLFLDVLDGTKALVSMPGSSPFLKVTQGALSAQRAVSQCSGGLEVRLSDKEVPQLLAPGRSQG
jgi:hypothetical protein